MNRMTPFAAIAATALFAAACGAADASPGAADSGGKASPSAAAAPATGNVVEVTMASNPGQGETFGPVNATVRRGDVLRFKLQSGVHNASFPAAKNPSGVKLPGATPYLQAPGQTHDLPIDLPPGEYHFQCDPHAALGMVGTLTVTD